MRRSSDTCTDDGWTAGYVRVRGRSVYYRRSLGDAPDIPVVHVHGFGISGSYLMPTARLLAGRRVNVVPDLPGYGRSERGEHVLGIHELAESLLAVLDEMHIDTAVLVGNSMGCPIGLEIAHAAPERVHRLVLVSPAGGIQNQPLPRALGQLGLDVIRESPRMVPVAVPDYLRFGPLNALHLFHELTRFPSLDRLLHVPVPSLAVLGGRDPLMPPADRVRDVGGQAHVSVVVIESAAHAINFSHPHQLARVINDWLDGRNPSGGPGVRVLDTR